jgi:hypothetical protein
LGTTSEKRLIINYLFKLVIFSWAKRYEKVAFRDSRIKKEKDAEASLI